MNPSSKNKKLIKTVSIVLSEDIQHKIQKTLDRDYKGSSFSYVVRDLLKKGLKVTEEEQEREEEMQRLYREFKKDKK